MDKSEDLSKNVWNVWNIQNIERKRKQIGDEVTDHKYHRHTFKRTISHWQLRLSHCPPHTAFILIPLAKPNNTNMTILLGI